MKWLVKIVPNRRHYTKEFCMGDVGVLCRFVTTAPPPHRVLRVWTKNGCIVYHLARWWAFFVLLMLHTILLGASSGEWGCGVLYLLKTLFFCSVYGEVCLCPPLRFSSTSIG